MKSLPRISVESSAAAATPGGLLVTLCLGCAIGVVIPLALYSTKTTYIALLPVGLLLLLPPLVLKNFRAYWLAIFLLSLQFLISKNLNDGLAVTSRLDIHYIITTLTFEITATDLVLVVLFVIWINDYLFHRKPLRFPSVSWLAVGYLIICLLSLAGARSAYLGAVDLTRQIKFFLVYLFAVNCLDSKSSLRTLAIVAVIMLATQAAVTAVRFETGYLTPLTFGDTHQDLLQISQYLTVNRSAEGFSPLVRAFGTLGSPNGTTRLCMMLIPFALFLCVPNALCRMRAAFAALTAFALLALMLTFTRVFYIVTLVQLVVALCIMARDRLLKGAELALIVLVGLGALAAASPWLYKQFTVRDSSMSVRALQSEVALKIILDRPLLGVGLNNAPEQMPNYTNVTYDRNDMNTQFYLEPINNMFLSMTSEIGVIGMGLFIAFFGAAARVAWRQSRLATEPLIRYTANAMLVVFLGVAVNGVMDPFDEYQVLMLLWLYAGICLNLPAMADSGRIAVSGGRAR